MRAVELIRKKREGAALADAEIRRLIDGYVAGDIPDYQLSAFLMAVFFRGLESGELTALTDAMMRSGEIWEFDLPAPKGAAAPPLLADKHSTGGVGDKVSLILAPLAAACGLAVPMVSGRGLGHTGGTLDKLESIPGFRTALTRAQFERQLRRIGLAMGGQTKKFVPADRKLYALRDVTATVESIPLIAASIMSKKLAEGCEILVLDVKTGSGAFMPTRADAERLARTMIAIGRGMGRKVSALLTDMNQPLGRAVGNANEVAESIECLRGGGPDDLMQVTRALTARMLTLGGLASSDKTANKLMDDAIASGAALKKFRELIEAQHGDARVVDDPARLPRAPHRTELKAPRAGYLSAIDTRAIGVAASALGAGRAVLTDKIDPAVGFLMQARLGDRIEKNQPLLLIDYRDRSRLDAALDLLRPAFTLADSPVKSPPLIHRRDVKLK